MDLFPAILHTPALLAPPLALVLVLLAFGLYWPYLAAWLSEFRVGMALSVLPKGDYTLLHDVLIPDEAGGTTRIDHLICGPAGYFVVETEAKAGRISGRADEAQWTQVLPGGRQRRFANPMLCNKRHADALRRLVGQVPVYTLVVFARARFPDDKPDGVLLPAELTPHIFTMEERAVPFDARQSLQELRQAMITEAAMHRRHARQRQQRYGSIWRKPAGHALTATAACMLVLSAPAAPPPAAPAPLVRYVPVPLATAEREAHPLDALRPTARRHHARHTATRHHRRRHHSKEPMQVIAMSDGMASIMEDGHIITLHPGQRSPKGWRLLQATPRYADMIGPHGRHFHFTP